MYAKLDKPAVRPGEPLWRWPFLLAGVAVNLLGMLVAALVRLLRSLRHFHVTLPD